MKLIGVTVVIFLKIFQVENRMLPYNFATVDPTLDVSRAVQVTAHTMESADDENEKVIGMKTYDDRDEEYENDFNKQRPQKPCAVVVLSSIQNPAMQSLLRKYRYDSNGVLIPSSVKYFIKLPQGLRASPLLVPLNDKAFSPLGGFVRYYKEVPPIPHSW